MHESFLAYKGFRYLKLSVWLVTLCLLAFTLHTPPGEEVGGTWLGYTLGAIAALLVLLMLWLGIRRRSYQSRSGYYQGWVSAHVYLGGSILVIASLHSGFNLGWNVHSLTYLLMLGAILSGLYGVFAYLRFPAQITTNRAGMSREGMVAEIRDLDKECLILADQLGTDIHALIVDMLENDAWTYHLFRRNNLEEHRPFYRALDEIAGSAARCSDAPRVETHHRLMEIMGRRETTLDRYRNDLRYHTRMRIWLVVHVPFSVGLLAALIAHVSSVFIYW